MGARVAAGGGARKRGALGKPARLAAMVEITLAYQGDLRTRCEHGPSGTVLHTDGPVDNQGRGESFSPTDLVATALGSCMLTIMGIVGERHGIDLSRATVKVVKHMVADPKRRIGRLEVEVRVPGLEDSAHRERLERAALTCPVHATLGDRVEMPVSFVWEA